MTKGEFIDFIWDLGFSQAWETNPDYFIMQTEHEQLNIHLSDESVQISRTRHEQRQITAGPFQNFKLETFGNDHDSQIHLFFNFLKQSFVTLPDSVVKHLRNENIKTILK